MYDAFNAFQQLAETSAFEVTKGLSRGAFALATLHRAENVDSPERLRAIVSALETIATEVCPVLLPLHPRTRKRLDESSIVLRRVQILPPVSYLEMVALESNARFIVTDSGGVQKEAYFAHTPCITTRDETEWVETLEHCCNVLVGADSGAIIQATANVVNTGPWLQIYGDGHSSELIIAAILQSRPSR
jgi:UDP-GlcNAc3NAcA epimerase